VPARLAISPFCSFMVLGSVAALASRSCSGFHREGASRPGEGVRIDSFVPERVVGLGQPDSSGVNGQLSAILIDAEGNQGTVSTTLYGFTPTNAVIVGTEGTVRFDGPFNLPGAFVVNSADGSQTLRYEEPSGRHFEGLYYEAAEVARRISGGELETPHRTLDSSVETMATLDMIRRAVGIDAARVPASRIAKTLDKVEVWTLSLTDSGHRLRTHLTI
ncbi:MAG TPA: hypothetical protein VGZ25_14885, partial [Gemmataceae bacterium]|nr:hypothetical protein [Gemmataceae bacterium]